MLNSVCSLKSDRLQFLTFYLLMNLPYYFVKLITLCMLNCVILIIQATEGRKLVSPVIHCRQNPIGMVGYSA